MKKYDIIVAGGGHAGIEAAAAAARLGMKTALITMDPSTIGKMSCNPAIGGLAKGHLVKEIDAMGGLMGQLIDEAGIHFKILNKSKGPAVWSPRAQADRIYYMTVAQQHLKQIPNLDILPGMVTGFTVDHNKITGAQINHTEIIPCRALILTTGTFLNGCIYTGLQKMESGRAGEPPAKGLTEMLHAYGFESGRLKTGTPPRIHIKSIDFSKVEEQIPDDPPIPFSHKTKAINRKQISCYITYTNEETHSILRTGFDESPMYLGMIQGTGPRYCPSIEDKIVRFVDKSRHQIFLEPEGYDNPEVYVNGFSTSLPERAQVEGLRSIPGLENAHILRLGYAIEYDFFPTYQINYTLETKGLEHLYFAGQINGTSGYEEAAAQGLMAGVNAALKLLDKEPLILGRDEAYIGVLIDDLINKETLEPYRLFTSRAEFRLLLRSDNADLRLMEKAKVLGLIDLQSWEHFLMKKEEINHLHQQLNEDRISPEEFHQITGGTIKQKMPAKEVLKRPEINLRQLLSYRGVDSDYSDPVITDVEFSIKYEGYVQRQQELVEKFKKMENKKIPLQLDYDDIPSISNEAREKLKKIRPANLGQASRIQGVRQSDLTVLMIYLEKYSGREKDVPRETVRK
ncbi:MAG: tRNA uridine-5-carboxymethylaminomethyl(34) synthesis enzyme MnmG [Calditrichia bacterium]